MLSQIKYDIVAFVAPQGAGKDTQMEILRGKLPPETTAAISMSDVLRHYCKTDADFSERIALMMSRGVLVGDDIAVERLMMYLDQECKGKKLILLNGYPRTMAQAFGLWAIAMKVHCPNARMAVLKFNLDHKQAYERCIGRINEMKDAGLQPRIDDTPELIDERLTTYFHNLPEIINATKLFAHVIEIDASKPVGGVTDSIVAAISETSVEPIS